MPWVTINLLAGRSSEKKCKLHEAVARAVYETLEIPADRVHVQLVDMKEEDYSVSGVSFDKQSK
ncbi:MAG: tautomerase family protein [Alphaproteobacteria bacterium]|nr:tautomerase family protein [Alphaproteobacteria bacterium]MBV8549584.1 tautomerase family protein [Alphaproteobacteria bacterium]